jgi:hypothetical protein
MSDVLLSLLMLLLLLLLLWHLFCRGRKVIDIQPKRPTSGVGPHDVMGTALAGLDKLLFLGDAEGKLLAWDTSTGKCSLLVTGKRVPAPAAWLLCKIRDLKEGYEVGFLQGGTGYC